MMTFNGRFASSVAIGEAARLAGVPIQYHERGATFDRFEIFEEPPHRGAFVRTEVARYWKSGDANRERIASSFFEQRRAGHGIGWVSYVTHQESGLLPDLPSGKRNVVFFTSNEYEIEFIGQHDGHSLFETQRDAVTHLMQWVGMRSDVTLVVRVHPSISNAHADDRAWWHSLAGLNVCVVPDDSRVDSYALIDTADVVVSSGSTAGIEATYWGRPSIVVADAYYAESGGVYEPRTPAELDALLSDSSLPALPRENCLSFGYHSAVFGSTFQYYQADTLFTGRFLGRELSYDATLLGLGRIARSIHRLFRGRARIEGEVAA